MKQPFVARTLSLVLFLFCSIFLSPDHLDARISFGQIKGLGGVIKPEYQHLCPLYGALLWETEYVKNLYRFGRGPTKTEDSDDYLPCTKLLLKQLFFFQHDGVTFSPTANPQYPAFHLGVQEISKIIALIELYQSPEDREKLRSSLNQIFEFIFDKIETENKAYISTSKEIEKLEEKRKAAESKARIGQLQKSIKQLQEKLSTLQKTTAAENLNPTAQQAISQFINKIINRYEELCTKETPESTEYKKLQSDIKKQRSLLKDLGGQTQNMRDDIKIFINCLCAALDEENTLYPQNHTIAIMLALLWTKAESKMDFIRYFDVIADQLGSTKYFTLDQVDFTENEEKMKAFTSAAYTARDYDELFESAGNTTSIDDFETLTFFYLGFKAFKSLIPPKIDMRFGVEYDDLSFPDCGETTLLSLFTGLTHQSAENPLKI